MEYAYVTGGASGLGRAVVEMLSKKGVRVFIADRDTQGASVVAQSLPNCTSGTLDASDWKSQVKSFTQAVSQFGRIDYVYPIAGVGERRWLPNSPTSDIVGGFEMPDLGVLDVDLNGVLYTVSLAIQQFRRQEPGANGYRGKIGCVASVCGFYCCPTLPIYTAAKHAVTGFVRSYGKYLPCERITLNAVNPNVVRTNISTGTFYDSLEEAGLLTPIEGVVDAFERLLTNEESGEIFEVGPLYKEQGLVKPKFPEYLDKESKEVFDRLEKRGKPLQLPG